MIGWLLPPAPKASDDESSFNNVVSSPIYSPLYSRVPLSWSPEYRVRSRYTVSTWQSSSFQIVTQVLILGYWLWRHPLQRQLSQRNTWAATGPDEEASCSTSEVSLVLEIPDVWPLVFLSCTLITNKEWTYEILGTPPSTQIRQIHSPVLSPSFYR